MTLVRFEHHAYECIEIGIAAEQMQLANRAVENVINHSTGRDAGDSGHGHYITAIEQPVKTSCVPIPFGTPFDCICDYYHNIALLRDRLSHGMMRPCPIARMRIES
jgi:hypothetical protein